MSINNNYNKPINKINDFTIVKIFFIDFFKHYKFMRYDNNEDKLMIIIYNNHYLITIGVIVMTNINV